MVGSCGEQSEEEKYAIIKSYSYFGTYGFSLWKLFLRCQ